MYCDNRAIAELQWSSELVNKIGAPLDHKSPRHRRDALTARQDVRPPIALASPAYFAIGFGLHVDLVCAAECAAIAGGFDVEPCLSSDAPTTAPGAL